MTLRWLNLAGMIHVADICCRPKESSDLCHKCDSESSAVVHKQGGYHGMLYACERCDTDWQDEPIPTNIDWMHGIEEPILASVRARLKETPMDKIQTDVDEMCTCGHPRSRHGKVANRRCEWGTDPNSCNCGAFEALQTPPYPTKQHWALEAIRVHLNCAPDSQEVVNAVRNQSHELQLYKSELERLKRIYAAAPIPMRLTCPECGELHVDVGEFATKVHHTHSCQACGLTWRPAVVATVGVQFLPGFKNP